MSAEAIRQKLLGRFREITRDRANRLGAALLKVENEASPEVLDEVARELHTLKGEARMMGFIALSTLIHTSEELLEGGLQGERLFGLRRACQAIPLLLDEPPEGGPSTQSLLAQLQALAGGQTPVPTGRNEAVGQSPAVAQAPVASTETPAATQAPVVPTDAPTGTEAPGASTEMPAATKAPVASADSLPVAEAAVAPAPKPAAAPTGNTLAGAGLPQEQTSIRIDLDTLDEIAGLTGDVLVEGAKAGARVRDLKVLLARYNALSDKLLAVAEAAADKGMREAAGAIEGEIHDARTAAFRFFHHHAESVGDVQRLFSILAERVAHSRLIPMAELFSDLPATAAALASEQGKKVELSIAGGETGIDKAILPSLHDPLVHLLRNAIDHGLATPAERLLKGKSEKGRIRVEVEPAGDRLQVTIEDDGEGIDADLIRRAAIRRNLLSEAEAGALPDRAILDQIFTPGFSTRETAGETSGRGVGLDVVRRRVGALGGTVSVESTRGVGTRFILRLPQNLSLMKALLFLIDDDVYGLPISEVDAVGRLDPSQVEEIAGIRAVRHRGKLMPVVAAGPLLGLNGGPSSIRPNVAYVRHGDEGLALVVDGFRGEREVAVKAPGPFLKGMRYVMGAAALEDGRVALLLSPAELLAAARRKAQLPSRRARSRKRVLLVDDSLIAREAEAALLRGLGHEVDEAGDGEEGYRKLRGGTYDLLVTDVQMPVLDGIELTRRVKSDPSTRSTPVVILSSLEAPQDKRRGLEAGADAYLGKAELDAEKLSRVVERLCGTQP